jgi:hypothetical protein
VRCCMSRRHQPQSRREGMRRWLAKVQCGGRDSRVLLCESVRVVMKTQDPLDCELNRVVGGVLALGRLELEDDDDDEDDDDEEEEEEEAPKAKGKGGKKGGAAAPAAPAAGGAEGENPPECKQQ